MDPAVHAMLQGQHNYYNNVHVIQEQVWPLRPCSAKCKWEREGGGLVGRMWSQKSP